jgi:hypothetical protein
MQETDPLYDHVRQLMLEVMAVLHSNGHKELHVGAMMRLIGVDEETAVQHDDERININDSFAELAEELGIQVRSPLSAPAGVTIH